MFEPRKNVFNGAMADFRGVLNDDGVNFSGSNGRKQVLIKTNEQDLRGLA